MCPVLIVNTRESREYTYRYNDSSVQYGLFPMLLLQALQKGESNRTNILDLL